MSANPFIKEQRSDRENRNEEFNKEVRTGKEKRKNPVSVDRRDQKAKMRNSREEGVVTLRRLNRGETSSAMEEAVLPLNVDRLNKEIDRNSKLSKGMTGGVEDELPFLEDHLNKENSITGQEEGPLRNREMGAGRRRGGGLEGSRKVTDVVVNYLMRLRR